MTTPQVVQSARPGSFKRAPLTPARIARLAVVPLVLIAIWYLLVAVFGSFAIAPPHAAIGAIVTGFREEWLWPALYITLSTTIIGFGIASGLGLTIAAIMGLSRFWGAVLESPLLWLYSIPKVTLYPVFLLVLGLTTESRVAFAVAHGFIPLTLFTFSGMQSVTPVHRRVQRLYRLAVDQDVPAVDILEAGDRAQRRRFAAAGGPEQHHELAVPDFQVEFPDDVVVAKILFDVPEYDVCHWSCVP